MDKLRLLADVPVGAEKDSLRFVQYASILSRAALDTPEPFTIGVYGGWGSGKTSLMRMIMKAVEDDTTVDGAIGVWFNAWRYEKEEHLIIPLLATIITEMKDREGKLESATKTSARKLRDALRAVLYGVCVKGKVGIPGLSEAELSISPRDMVERYEKLSEMATDKILDQSLYFRSFSRLDDIARNVKGVRLIVFIDDLDRCFPDKAVALLENVKLVLNQPNITFVLGIAPNIIRAYLKAKYKKDYDIRESLYEDYLDKLVQLPFPIPEVQANIPAFVRSLLKREDVFGKIPPKEFKKDYEPLVSICGPACKNNPRGIIRFLNRLLLLRRIHKEKKKADPKVKTVISLVHFGITIALQMKWEQVYHALELNWEIPVLTGKDKKTLCDLLADGFSNEKSDQNLITEFEGYAKADNNPEKDVFNTLAKDESLRQLLRSEPGIEWLKQPELRREAAEIIQEVKVETAETGKAKKYEVEWAEDYRDGWPVCRGYVIRPRGNLSEAILSGANFNKADLSKADLSKADLSMADLSMADLSGANLHKANLSGTNLRRANLSMVGLSKTDLSMANLSMADLSMADLSGANLHMANLSGTNLRRANLSMVGLSMVNLSGANLNGTNLSMADLRMVDLSEADLRAANLLGAKYNSRTKWPKGFDPQERGATKVD